MARQFNYQMTLTGGIHTSNPLYDVLALTDLPAGVGTVTSVAATQPAAGLTISGSPVTTSGTLVFALADDLAALEALSGTNTIYYRSGASTWSAVTIGTNLGFAGGTLGSALGTAATHAASDFQSADSTLTALAAYNTNGLLVQTAADTFAGRTITGTSDVITVTNGDGVSGNPTLTIAATYVGQSSITTLGTITAGVWNGTTIAVAKGGTGQTSYADGQLLIGNSTGNTLAKGTLTAPAAGITITNGAGSITFALANDLSALEAMSGTGLVARTASETYSQRTITGTSNQISVSNGDGVSGNPTLSLTLGTPRELLSAARTYYVRTDGSDSNTGLVDSAGGAFLTVQKAINVASGLDLGGQTVTIQIKDGTFTGANTLKTFVGDGTIVIQGNSGTPANVVISTTSATCFSMANVQGNYTVKDLKVATTTSGDCFNVSGGSLLTLGNIVFGASAGNHVAVSTLGVVTQSANYSIVGNAVAHWSVADQAVLVAAGLTITLTGTPNFTSLFAAVTQISFLFAASNTFSGSGTGKRYNVDQNGVIYVGGAGTTYLPGNVAGTTATGGQYN